MDKNEQYEVEVYRESSLCRIVPMTAEARAWLEENCQWESYQLFGGAYVTDWRMAEPILDGMRDAGFSVMDYA